VIAIASPAVVVVAAVVAAGSKNARVLHAILLVTACRELQQSRL
jgi:hypothetical protein